VSSDDHCGDRVYGYSMFNVNETHYQDLGEQIKSQLVVGEIRLVILKPQKNLGPEANFLGFDPSGKLMWQVDPPLRSPSAWDGFVNMRIKEGQVWVGSWSGFSMRIDHRTGEILETVFTK
jgi:hypothetical protein